MKAGAGLVIALVTYLGALCDWAHAQQRIALVIGNQNYSTNVGRLQNPHNDVALLGQTLKRLDFDVTIVRDAGLADLSRAVNAHIRRVQDAGPEAIAFFYYSGHGAQDATTKTNYLIPVDVTSGEGNDLWDRSMRLTDVTRQLKSEAGNATHFVVFDACRNALRVRKPGTRSLMQPLGFAPVNQVTGMLIAYATAEGEVATDEGDGAGHYARTLAEEMVRPNVEAVTMFRRVQVRVRNDIQQEPWLGFNNLNEVHFAGLDPSLAPSAPTEPAPAPRATEASREWTRIDKGSVAELETFLRRHGSSPEADYARARLEELRKSRTGSAAAQGPTVAAGSNELLAACREESDTAIKACNELVGRNQNSAAAHYYRGNAYLKLNQLDAAISDFSRSAELSPRTAETYHYRGLAFARKKDYDRAMRDFEQAVALKPAYDRALTSLGEVYAVRGQHDRALEYVNKAIAIKPSARAHAIRGDAYQAQGSRNRAMAEYRQALALDANFLPAKQALQRLGVKR